MLIEANLSLIFCNYLVYYNISLTSFSLEWFVLSELARDNIFLMTDSLVKQKRSLGRV